MSFVVRECPGKQYSVTGADEFDQPIGTWAELVDFARDVLEQTARRDALSRQNDGVSCRVIVPKPDGGDLVAHGSGCACFGAKTG